MTKAFYKSWFEDHYLRFVAVGLAILLLLCCQLISSCDSCNCIDVGKVKRESGEANIEVRNLTALGNPQKVMSVSVNYSGTATAPSDGGGDVSFATDRTYEVTPMSVNPNTILNRKNLRPGTWEITVTVGNWSGKRQGTIEKKKATNFIFVYGQ